MQDLAVMPFRDLTYLILKNPSPDTIVVVISCFEKKPQVTIASASRDSGIDSVGPCRASQFGNLFWCQR